MDLVIYGRMDQIYGLGGFDHYDDKYNVEEDYPPTLSVEREGKGEGRSGGGVFVRNLAEGRDIHATCSVGFPEA